MSGTTISALPAASAVGSSDEVPIVQLGSPNVTKRAAVSQLTTQVLSALNGGTITGPLSITTNASTGNEVPNISQFALNASASGSIALPGGIALQWGIATTGGGGTVTVTFPAAFSAAAWTVVGTAVNGAIAVAMTLTDAPTDTAATFMSWNATAGVPNGGTTFYWYAVGP